MAKEKPIKRITRERDTANKELQERNQALKSLKEAYKDQSERVQYLERTLKYNADLNTVLMKSNRGWEALADDMKDLARMILNKEVNDG